MKIIKTLIVIIVISLLFGCSDISLQEFDYIMYSGKKYEVSGYWKPVGDQTKQKLLVNLIHFDSTVNMSRKYTAYGFERDKDTTFLFIDHRLFVQVDTKFVDLMSDATVIEKIEFFKLDSWSKKLATTNDAEFITSFMQEYRGNGTIFHKFDQNINPQEYEVRLFPKGYFAYHFLDRLENDIHGDFGFRHDVEEKMLVRMFTKNLNKKFKELLK